MASRRKGRIQALKALYAWDISGSVPDDDLSDSALPDDFSRLLIAGSIENIASIDAMIRRHLENWTFSRVNRVDLALLRISTYALMYQKETAPSIIINEAVSISKEYGTDDSYRFVNGVLDGIRKTLEIPDHVNQAAVHA